jgi:hypothetical protein
MDDLKRSCAGFLESAQTLPGNEARTATRKSLARLGFQPKQHVETCAISSNLKRTRSCFTPLRAGQIIGIARLSLIRRPDDGSSREFFEIK